MTSKSALNFEVIVVDNNSLPSAVKGLKEQWPDINWIFNDNNLGLAKANNQAARHARGEYILFLNPDVIIKPDALLSLVNLLKNNPNCGAGSCVKLQDDKGAESIFRSYPIDDPKPIDALLDLLLSTAVQLFPNSKTVNKLKLKQALKIFDLTCLNTHDPFEVDMVWGACCIVRKDAFVSIGGFDENFFYGAEDKDLCLRLRNAGWKILLLPSAKVEHSKGVSISLWGLTERESLKTFSRLFMYKKHKGLVKLSLNFIYECIIHMTRCICDTLVRIKTFRWVNAQAEERKIGLIKGLVVLVVNYLRVFTGRQHPVSLNQTFKV